MQVLEQGQLYSHNLLRVYIFLSVECDSEYLLVMYHLKLKWATN